MKSHKICYQSRLASIITVYTDLTSKLKLKWLPGARSTGAQLIRLLPILKYMLSACWYTKGLKLCEYEAFPRMGNSTCFNILFSSAVAMTNR